MNTDVLPALISASAAVLTAVVALALNHRAFTGLENRLTAMDSSTNSRFIALKKPHARRHAGPSQRSA